MRRRLRRLQDSEAHMDKMRDEAFEHRSTYGGRW
jgi:hypothetical protein